LKSIGMTINYLMDTQQNDAQQINKPRNTDASTLGVRVSLDWADALPGSGGIVGVRPDDLSQKRHRSDRRRYRAAHAVTSYRLGRKPQAI
jgi:hypothetical protein